MRLLRHHSGEQPVCCLASVGVTSTGRGFSLLFYCTHDNRTRNVSGLVFCVFCPYSTDMEKPRRGRPPKGADKVKGIRLDVRLEEAEKEAFRQAAELSGLDMSAWIRERLRTASWKELERAGMPVPFIASNK